MTRLPRLPGLQAALGLLACALAVAAQAQPQPEAASARLSQQALVAQRFMVVAANPCAADAGAEVLRAGGNAVDAAVAVQMVLGLVEPQSSGIGGGLFLLHWNANARSLTSYDGRETAPMAARLDRFLDAAGRPLGFYAAIINGRSVGVPGTLRALELAHRRHGRLPWAQLFERAVRLAQEGFPMSPRLHRLLERERFLREDARARALYYGIDARPKPVGTPIVNAAYAATLAAIAAHGPDVFYSGAIAREIVRAVGAHARPGDLSEQDLARYAAIEREPVCGVYRSYRLCGMGPPSSGGIGVLQLLGLLERTQFERAAPGSELAVHLFAEAGRLVYADRARHIADPAFVPQPVAGLLDADYLDARAALIGARSMGRARPGTPRGAQAQADGLESEHAGTSHVSIIDPAGNAVAMTTTIENQFGSRIMVGGFLLNNELSDFSFVPEVDARPAANRVEPGKRPRSTMAPTLVFERDGRLKMVLGSPGGIDIINYVARVLVATLDWKLDIQSAISLPNFGSANEATLIELGTSYENLAAALAGRGHSLEVKPLTSGLHGIERVDAGWRSGVDPRREGAARGD